MSRTLILYNPLAGCGTHQIAVDALVEKYENAIKYDVTKGIDFAELFAGVTDEDTVILCGGDGTLNRFVNDTRGLTFPKNLLYFADGTGNDFLRDIEADANSLIDIKKYISELPTVTVNGKEYCFINGVGFGIDGYCCEVGDKQRAEGKTKINYTAIAIMGLLFHYHPTAATVIVDGQTYEFDKVWIAPTMNGRFYGGGMMPTPKQDRLREDGKLSLLVFHGTGKLRTLTIFPSLFEGEHVKHTKNIAMLEGDEITVKFDRPVSLQIDGETHIGVTEYSAKSRAKSRLTV